MESVLLQASMTLLAASLTAWLAVYTYFRQREHELILTRYLEGGLDLLASELGRVSETFSHNWARCLSILKSYRESEEQFDLSELSKGFIELQSSNHNIVAHHRLYTLTGSHDYWVAYQHAMAFFTSANSVLVKEIPEAIRVKLSSARVTAPHSEVAETAFLHAKQQNDDSYKYIELVTELQSLSAALESERYRFKNLHKFRNKQEVTASLQRIKELIDSFERENDAQQGAPADQ